MNNRTILQFDLHGNFIAKWNRVVDAARSVSAAPNTIIHCCHNRPKYAQAKGYIWLYTEDADKINERVNGLPVFCVDNQPNEEWRDVVGYEGLYQVSNLGRVKSLRAHNKWGIERESILIPAVEKKGYKRFCLNKNGKGKTVKLHRIIAQAFIPNPDNKPCVDHIDGNPSNNNVSNLRWVTYWKNKHNPATRRRVVKAVAQYTIKGEHVRDWFSAYDAATSTGVKMGSIRACCRGEIYSTAGYKWKYTNHK